MKNRDVYVKDPSVQKLVNEGVATVNDDRSAEAMAVLRYELETFVCDGQYEKGMELVLETYLNNIDQANQPAVWISGFYGSGKSHLVKMLRALWENVEFEDGATARGIADLPQSIKDLIAELATQGKRHGGLRAASGTLGAGASGSVRLALLRIVFKSAGLPELYPLARFVMWLKKEGIYDEVRELVESSGDDWEEELDNLYVAESLHDALVKVKPRLFSSSAACAETLNNLYPHVKDIGNDEMLKTLKDILSKDGKFPLTLIVLDEIQLYIGEDAQRAMRVQEVVEACCKNIGGKLLFIGTGQTAVTGTSNLKKLEGRFTVRVELSDADVDAVVRKVVLAKNADAASEIDRTMQANLGEISRHLSGSAIGHHQDDVPFFVQDYPILPVRRRFWENTLRVLDPTGTDSQLRNQLGMIHKAIRTNLDDPLGNVIEGDYIYFDSANRLLQARILPRKVHEKTMKWVNGSKDERLMARACGLVFLINKLAGKNTEIGLKATVETVADLMVQDLPEGSGALRGRLPDLMDKCELLMKVGDEYRIQTEESTAWNDEFLSQRGKLNNEAYRIEAERDDRIRKKFGDKIKKLSLTQGASKVPRNFYPVFHAELPADSDKKVYIWVRDGWTAEENSVRADALAAGNQSPTVYVFIPKRSADALRHNLIEYKAAVATLEKRGVPNTPEGAEARSAMETTRQTAEGKINELLDEALSGARVFQGGGSEIVGNDLKETVPEAAGNAIKRLYTKFNAADHNGWSKVYEKAKKGAPDALKAVGDEGEPAKNPVCKEILGYIGSGRNGAEIRDHFENPEFGWSRDAVDGGLHVLLIAGLIRAANDKGKTVKPTDLERKAVGKTMFKVESTTVTTPQRIQIRKVFQKMDLKAKQGEESAYAAQFLQKMLDLAESAGGVRPRPETPDTSSLEEMRLTSGNEQLLLIYNRREELSQNIKTWQEISKRIEKRLPAWELLERLVDQAAGSEDTDFIREQFQQIERHRKLIEDPDPVAPLLANVTQLLRDELNRYKKEYDERHQKGMERLQKDENWAMLSPEQRHELLAEQKLTNADAPVVEVGSAEEIASTLRKTPLTALSDRVAAFPARFQEVVVNAAALMEPEAQFVTLPGGTLKTDQDVESWLEDAKKAIQKALKNGPVIIS